MQKDKPLSNRFAQFGSEPSGQVWTKIESELKKNRKKRFLLLFWVGAPVLLSLGIFTFLTIDIENQNSNLLTEHSKLETPQKIKNKVEFSSIVELEEVEDDNHAFINTVQSKVKGNHQFTKAKKNEIEKKEILNLETKVSTNPTTSKSNLELEQSEVKEKKMKSSDQINPNLPSEEKPKVELVSNEHSLEKEILDRLKLFEFTNSQKRWSIGIYAGSGFDLTGERSSIISEGYTDINLSPSTNQNSSEQLKRINSRIHLQFLISYSMKSRLSITTGVGYTQLSQHLSLVNGNYTEVSTFGHLINHPINLNFAYINRKKFRAYLGGGYTNSLFHSTHVNGVKYLGSIQIQTGLQFNISNRFSLDVQPTLQRFVMDKSGMELKGKMIVGGAVGLTYGVGR